MKNINLIQRGKCRGSMGKGLDGIVSFDYMGSAEFEFGALPDSLRRVRANIGQYVIFQYSFKDSATKTVTVFCKRDEQIIIPGILESLANRSIRTKEHTNLPEYVNPSRYGSREVDFWWDIDNDWFFWKMDEKFAEKFIQAINIK